MTDKNKKDIKKLDIEKNKDFKEKMELVKKFQPKKSFQEAQKENLWTIAY